MKNNDERTHLVILDTDPGIDDAMTFAFLKSRRDVRLLAITTVFGNADVATTTRNALYLVDRFGMDVPVHAGAPAPLSISRRPVASHVHGHDALGNTGMADGFTVQASGEAAHDAIVRLVRENPYEVSILAIAPLTNLALALRAAPDIARLVREVVVMGGAFGYGSRRGNVSPVAEANVANDPHAADEVLGASWPVTMVGLDVTSQCILPASVAAEIAEHGGADGRFLWDISRDYEQLYRDHDGLEGGCIHDVAAAIRMVEPGLFQTISGPVRVVTEGIAIGQTVLCPEGMPFPAGAWDGVPSQRACIQVDSEAMLRLYRAAFASPVDAASASAFLALDD